MPFWNLSNLDALETPVLTPLGPSTPQRRAVMPGQYRSSPIRTVMRVAALAAVSYSVAVCGSSDVLVVSHEVAHAACNVDADRPPLEALFETRFNDQWTRTQEDDLLAEAVKKSASSDRDFLNLVHTAQHESLSEDAPRLTEGDIRKLTRRKA